jgi:WD40 repeat protein
LQEAIEQMSYHRSSIRALAFSSDGRTLVSGSEDNTVKFLNVVFHQQMGSLNESSPVRQIRFSPDGNTLAILTDQGRLRFLRAVTVAEAVQEGR